MKHQPIAVFVVAVFIAFMFSACGGGDSDPVNNGTPPPSANSTDVAGVVVVSNELRDSTVRVFDWSAGSKGAELGSAKTDSLGRFSLILDPPPAVVLVEVVDGIYFEDASNNLITLDANKKHRLSTVAVPVPGQPLTTHVTGFTTMATGLAEYLVANQGVTAQNAALAANQSLSAWLDLDIRTVKPKTPSNPTNASAVNTAGHKYGFLGAAVSELTLRAANPPHDQWTSIEFFRLAYDDIRRDGQLDGQGTGGVLMLNNVAMNVDFYRALLAERMQQFVLSSSNNTTLDFKTVLPHASIINLYTGNIFGNAQVATDITQTMPTIMSFVPQEGATIGGSYDATANVSDKFGLKLAQYFVDGKFVATAGKADVPISSIDTLNFANGARKITIEITNILDNKASLTHNITIQN